MALALELRGTMLLVLPGAESDDDDGGDADELDKTVSTNHVKTEEEKMVDEANRAKAAKKPKVAKEVTPVPLARLAAVASLAQYGNSSQTSSTSRACTSKTLNRVCLPNATTCHRSLKARPLSSLLSEQNSFSTTHASCHGSILQAHVYLATHVCTHVCTHVHYTCWLFT